MAHNHLQTRSVRHRLTPGFLPGFTLVELLVVMAVVSLLATVGLMSFRASRTRISLQEAESVVQQVLGSARSRAATGVGAAAHGVRLTPNGLMSFDGPIFNAETAFAHSLPPGVRMNQEATDVVFERITAVPNVVPGALPLQITLTNVQTSELLNLQLTSDGIVTHP
jgi:prepilin-type N-terminal cleavage/methylation domain-containing protein